MADSLKGIDPQLSERVLGSSNWRRDYLTYFAESTRLAAKSSDAALQIAMDGASSFRSRMTFVDDSGEMSIDDALAVEPAEEIETLVIRGSGTSSNHVEVPYKGQMLSGESLHAQLAVWANRGIVEPGFVSRIEAVIEHPEWLSLPGRQVVVVGAGSAMGPYASLVRWGANVIALDVPGEPMWDRIRATAEAGAGTVTMPVRVPGTGGPQVAGLNLIRSLPEVRHWLDATLDSSRSTIFGMYAYADGGSHVEVTAAADVLADHLLATRADTALAYLATPTDSFLVPLDAMEHSRRGWDGRGFVRHAQSVAKTISAGRLFKPAYPDELVDAEGTRWGLSNTLVSVQGPNYTFAKRVQRWRGLVARSQGHAMSFSVAPATWTRSVTKNRALASVYAGAHRFGVEIFDADTASALLAAKLVADLHLSPAGEDAHPEALFSDHAAHGGLWRQPFEPLSALGVAGLIGLPRTLVGSK